MSQALREVAAVADALAADQHQVAAEIRQVADQRDAGRSWAAILGDGAGPSILELVRRNGRQLGELSRTLQQTIARGLRSEGRRHRDIAQVLDVSRQRVTKLLGSSSPPA